MRNYEGHELNFGIEEPGMKELGGCFITPFLFVCPG